MDCLYLEEIGDADRTPEVYFKYPVIEFGVPEGVSSLSNTLEQLKQFAASLQAGLRPQQVTLALVAGAIANISAVMYARLLSSLLRMVIIHQDAPLVLIALIAQAIPFQMATTWRRQRTCPLTLQVGKGFATPGHAFI
ncbi:hypothetical protein IQ265_14555 [Nodosilinea sp. LEGE 06152]|uniref:hypothetical protein n=1 Tax=Nodosilinea sp. LEGE 06152 TaxID=2777966 RepID=UPI001882CADA|nr:hypothetical protein [Nodosilinea sp. LEGE 06152]MBE9158037.1 hypothetical protein [Nodosilinea sp. LEGE 06152]